MRRLFLMAVATFVMLGATSELWAQAKYPDRPVRIVTAFGAGSATDIVARLLAEQLRQGLGENVIVENKPGASGILAVEEMARAKPDGHTLMLGNISTNVITPLLYRDRFSINFEKDVVHVSRVGILPNLFVCTVKNFPPKTMAEFVAYAKERPGQINYATNAVGSFPHFDSEILARRAEIKMTHIPVKEGPPAFMRDMVTGDIHCAFVNAASAAPLVKNGSLRPLAAVADQRIAEYPDVPTMAEVGFPDVGTQLWSGLLAHSATPQPILEAIHAAVTKALQSDALQASFKKQSVIPAPTKSLADNKAWVDEQTKKWRGIIDEVKIDIPK
jgi:tripartite-type tricarboxylate transporter receptor subunit TctC